MTEESKDIIKKELSACVQALDDKKAEDLKVLFLGEKSSITDYYVIATGTSEPHLRALRVAVDRALSEIDATVLGVDAETQSGWIVVDAHDFIVHLFTKEQR